MAWIKTVSPEEADGPLKDLYQRAFKRAGRLWHILRLQSINPEVLKASASSAGSRAATSARRSWACACVQ